MCRNCSDKRMGPCVCDKHAAEIRTREACYRAMVKEIDYWKRERRAALKAGMRFFALECEAMLARFDVMESEYEGGAL